MLFWAVLRSFSGGYLDMIIIWKCDFSGGYVQIWLLFESIHYSIWLFESVIFFRWLYSDMIIIWKCDFLGGYIEIWLLFESVISP